MREKMSINRCWLWKGAVGSTSSNFFAGIASSANLALSFSSPYVSYLRLHRQMLRKVFFESWSLPLSPKRPDLDENDSNCDHKS
jgi:hypothetical protein